MKASLLAATGLILVLLLSACSGDSMQTPEDTVLATFEALTAQDTEAFIALLVLERRESARQGIARFGLEPGSFADVETETLDQTGDTATLAVTFDLDTRSTDARGGDPLD